MICFKKSPLHFKKDAVRLDKFYPTSFQDHFCSPKQKLKMMKKIDLILNVIRAIRITIGSIILIAMGLTIVIGMASCSKENTVTPPPATQLPVRAAKKISQISYTYNGSASDNGSMTYDVQGTLATYTGDDLLHYLESHPDIT